MVELEVRLAEEGIELDIRLDVMDGLDIKLEADDELAIMLELAVDGFDISTAVRKRTCPVCPCGLPSTFSMSVQITVSRRNFKIELSNWRFCSPERGGGDGSFVVVAVMCGNPRVTITPALVPTWEGRLGWEKKDFHPKSFPDSKECRDSEASSFVLSDDVVAARQHLVHSGHHAYL